MMPATPRSSSIPQVAAPSPNARCRVRSGMICRSRASSSASISAAVPTYRSETIFGRPPTRAISRKYQYVLPLIFFGYRLAINLGHTPEQPRGQPPNQHVTSRNASASASHWASDNHDHRKLKLVDPGGYAGCYAARVIAGDPGPSIAHHAWGSAIDLNASANPQGLPPHQNPRLVRIFERWGFTWGGRWLVPDGMHFELLRLRPTQSS